MSAEEFKKKYSAIVPRSDISTAEGLKAASIILEQAKKEGIKCAIAGGLAMHIFGYLRATHDVDFLASKNLNLEYQQKLSFGGLSHLIEVGERNIIVDVIVRDDLFRDFYDAALQDSYLTADGWPVIAPEWMVILKFLARRSKDILDLLWMLREPGMINRDRVTQLLEQVMGKSGAQVALAGIEPYYVQAEVMRAGDENGRQER